MVSIKLLRTFQRNCANWPAINRPTMLSQKTYNDFQNSFTKIINDGLSQTKFLDSSDVKERIRKMTAYHTLERVQVYGQLTLFAYHEIEDSRNITQDLTHQINVLAWCVEMLFSYYLMTDDVEDGAKFRFGKPCWHLLPNVGSMVLNDSSMFRSFIYELLSQNLSGDTYDKISKLFNKTFLRCDYGQYLDSISAKTRDFSKFNMDLYHNVSNSKFTFPSTIFPILVALILSNKANKDSIRNTENALKNIGAWIQMHNDIMDWCDESMTGKSNIDIQKGKPSWLAATALERCNPSQRELFLTHYGRENTEDVEIILKLYKDLKLCEVFCEQHCAYLNSISQQISGLPHNSIPSSEFFHKLVKKIYPFVVFFPEALIYDQKNQQHAYV